MLSLGSLMITRARVVAMFCLISCSVVLYLYIGAMMHRDRIGPDWTYLRNRHDEAARELKDFLRHMYQYFDSHGSYPSTIGEAVVAFPHLKDLLYSPDGAIAYDIDFDAMQSLGDRLGVQAPIDVETRVIALELEGVEGRKLNWRITESEIIGMRTALLSDGRCVYLRHALDLPFRNYATIRDMLDRQ